MRTRERKPGAAPPTGRAGVEGPRRARSATVTVPKLRRILVATSGSPTADGALRVAHALAGRSGAAVELLTVFTPEIPPVREVRGGRTRVESADRPEIARLLARVRAQRRHVLGPHSRWPVRVEVGFPPVTIAQAANELRADLVVLGIGRAEPAERQRGDETALRLAYMTDVPVLVVPGGQHELPRRAVVEAETVNAGVRGARLALGLMREPGTLCLVRARGESVLRPPTFSRQPAAVDDERVFERITRRLEPLPHGPIQQLSVSGERIDQLLELMSFPAGDLLVVPLHGRSFAERSVMEYTVSRLLRNCCASMLLLPLQPSHVSAPAAPALSGHVPSPAGGVVQPGGVART